MGEHFFQSHCGSLSAVNRRLAVQTCRHTLQSYAPDQQSWQPLLRSEQPPCILLSTKVSRVTVGDAEVLLRQACMSAPLLQSVMLWEPDYSHSDLIQQGVHRGQCKGVHAQRSTRSTDVVK